MIGLEFLYEHLALGKVSQTTRLLGVLDNLNPSVHEQRLNWVRGLEFTIHDNDADGFSPSEEITLRLVLKLRSRGKLRRFGIDCGKCCGTRSHIVSSMIVKLITKRDRLEVFHLPYVGSVDFDFLWVLSTVLPGVRTLSLAGTTYTTLGAPTLDERAFIALEPAAGSIRTLLVNCIPFRSQYTEAFLVFLMCATLLETIHIIATTNTSILKYHLDRFLQAVPRLKRLEITPKSGTNRSIFVASVDHSTTFVHHWLEEIVLHFERCGRDSHSFVHILQPLITKIRLGQLPFLRKIVIYGDFPQGCLDGYQILAAEDVDQWADMIECCEDQGVAVVNQEGYDIHLLRRSTPPASTRSSCSSRSSTDDDYSF